MRSQAPAAIDLKSLCALAGEWIAIACAMTLAIRFRAPWCYAAAGLLIATRQHALLVLFHDAVHGHLARRRVVNDALINLFAGVPTLLPVELYRPLHLQHHRMIATPQDPERVLLYADQRWNYRPLKTPALLRQLLGDLFLLNGIRTIRAWMRAAAPVRITGVTIVIACGWLGAVAAGFRYAPVMTITLVLLWIVPLLTVTQLLQKLRSYAEHSAGPNVTPDWPHWTYSWRVAPAGRLSIWPYNINYHREHHANPDLRWHELPGAGDAAAERLEARRLWRLLHRC